MTGEVLVVRDEHLDQLHALARVPLEQAAILVVGEANVEPHRLLLREIHVIDPEHFEEQTAQSLSIRSDGYVQALRRAEQLNAAALFLHTHPQDPPLRSRADAEVDDRLQPVFTARTGREVYGSIVLTAHDGALSFTGRVNREGTWQPIDRLWAIGHRLRLISAFDAPDPAPPPEIFDRQMAAFGPDFQHLVGQLTVGVVGAGGTGSATAEQLVRLGVGRLLLFDHDTVTDTNLTRIHEAVEADIGKPKAEALADRLRNIGTGTEVTSVSDKITRRRVAQRLRACDLVFGCTDDQTGRVILARLAYRYLVPVIDMAFIIQRQDHQVRNVVGRVTTMLPGAACLFCRDRIDDALLEAEAFDDEERAARVREGYAQGLPQRDPAVVPYTTLVSALSVAELMERIVGFDQPPPNELLILLHERAVLRSTEAGSDEHWCADPATWGRGDEPLFLGRTWPD